MRETRKVSEKLIESVRSKYGSPVYIFDESSFVENYKNLEGVFQRYYPKYRIAYSYKTNYTPHICKCVKKLGGLAEVVSDFEYYVAKSIGYDDADIIYNGPYKEDGLERLIAGGGILNIDNTEECERIEILSKRNPHRIVKVGIRINIDAGQGYISRFGLEPESDDFDKVISIIKNNDNIRLVGLHCHIGQARALKYWEGRVDNILNVADKLFVDTPPEYIDLGSGMFGDMEEEFRKEFGGNVPTYEDYATIVAKGISDYYSYLDDKQKPWLYTEPGSTLISRYMWLIATITSHKKVRERTVTGLDCSFFNAGETSRYKQLPIHVYNHNKVFILGDIVGYTCLEDDIIKKDDDRYGAIGDSVLIGNVGGYSVVFKPPFIQPDIPIVALDENDSIKLIRKRQSYDEMLSNYIE